MSADPLEIPEDQMLQDFGHFNDALMPAKTFSAAEITDASVEM